MPNPFSALNPANPYNSNNMVGFRNIYQTIMNSNNPMQLFQQYAARNPALQPALNMFRQGMTPEQVFNSMCQQRGINPQEFLKNITGK